MPDVTLEEGRRVFIAQVIDLAVEIRTVIRAHPKTHDDPFSFPGVSATDLAYRIITDEDAYRFKCDDCHAGLHRYSPPHDCQGRRP